MLRLLLSIKEGGHTTRRGSDISAKIEHRVYYFKFVPFLSTLENDAEPNAVQLLYISVGLLLLWSVNRKKHKRFNNKFNEGVINMSDPVFDSNTQNDVLNDNTLIGFSEKINDPAFASYKKKSVAWSFIFAGILAIITVVAFPIYGEKSGEVDWPQSLYYGMGIGGMFIVIALLQTIKRALDKTWDGVVEFKDSYCLRERSRDGHTNYTMIYILKIRKDSGGVKKHKWRNIPGPYSYYNVGDKVRHHKGFYYYEKFDKSKDTQIMCAACMSFHDINKDICPRCRCPLLK